MDKDKEASINELAPFFSPASLAPEAYLSSLTAHFNLSVRATNIVLKNFQCVDELLAIPIDVIKSLPNCGQKSAKEIFNFINEIHTLDGNPPIEINLFKDFLNSSDLSVRATNIVLKNFDEVESLLQVTYSDLKRLPSCGAQSCIEIIKAVEEYRENCDPEKVQPLPTQLTAPITPENLIYLPLFGFDGWVTITAKALHDDYKPSTSISELDLTAGTKEILQAQNINTVGELILTPRSTLLEYKHFGERRAFDLERTIRTFLLVSGADAPGKSINTATYADLIKSFIANNITAKRDLHIAFQRLCFDAVRPPSLEELGLANNITRERVRQIQKRAFSKLMTYSVADQLRFFWNKVEDITTKGGGIISLEELAYALRIEFSWPIAPSTGSLKEFLKLHPGGVPVSDPLSIPCECTDCETPNSFLASLDLAKEEALHLHVVSNKLSHHCKEECVSNPVDFFHPEFIRQALASSSCEYFIHNDLVFSKTKGVSQHGTKLKDVITSVLKLHGSPLHFSEIANIVRESNRRFKEQSDRNIHSTIIRLDSFEIVDRGHYGLKEWGLGGYQSVSTAIEELLEKEGIPLLSTDIHERLEGKYQYGNITSALSTPTRFTNVGQGFFDLPNRWTERGTEYYITKLPPYAALMIEYLCSHNNTSYKMALGLLIIRSMKKDYSVSYSKLKDYFFNFYKTRMKQGLVVEKKGAVVSQIGTLGETEIRNAAIKEPIKAFQRSAFFTKHGYVVRLNKKVAADFLDSNNKTLAMLALLKELTNYYSSITPESAKAIQPDVVEDSAPPTSEENNKPNGSITLKRRKRGRIKL